MTLVTKAAPRGTTFPILNLAFSGSTLFTSGWTGRGGLQGWQRYQLAHQDVPMAPGPGFVLFQKFLWLNTFARDRAKQPLVNLHIVSRQDPACVLRLQNSLQATGLTDHYRELLYGSYIKGQDPSGILQDLGAHCYFSTSAQTVRTVLAAGVPAARIVVPPARAPTRGDQLVLSFDGDAVIFSDSAERIFQAGGLEVFTAHEQAHDEVPLPPGPLLGLLLATNLIRGLFPYDVDASPLKLVLVTARGIPSQERATRTAVNHWGVRFDEMHFMSGKHKGRFIRRSGADIHFDDGTSHIRSATQHGILGGHVIWGVKNRSKDEGR
jgi:5'-nucleotidase